MKFSVLMSVYAKEKARNLDDAMKSILNQTLLPNEIVIVRDGPLTDELDAVLQKYTKNNKTIKIVTLEKNSGLGIALNKGIENCSYDIIARVDSDDVSVPERFKEQVGYLRLHPEVDIISSNIIEFDENLENELTRKNVPETDTDIKTYIKKRCPFNHMAVMYRKEVIVKAGSYEDCPYFEDYYLWCKVFKNGGSFYNIQKPLVHARGGVSMISRRGGVGYVKHIYHFQQKMFKLGIINEYELVRSLLIRSIISLVPNTVRGAFYRQALRGGGES